MIKRRVRVECPVHGEPEDFDVTVERVEKGATVYEDRSSVGYSRTYADRWDEVFGNRKKGEA